MKSFHRFSTKWGAALVAMTMVAASSLPGVNACGLEPVIGGGFSVSYPGSLNVAVAVASARRNGILTPASREIIPNEVLLQQMLSDLRLLKLHLDKGKDALPTSANENFSLVLIGPGLWSHFHLTGTSVHAEYHTDGPIGGETVVVTHHTVLQELLDGDLDIDKALQLGLIAFSGTKHGLVKAVIASGMQSRI